MLLEPNNSEELKDNIRGIDQDIFVLYFSAEWSGPCKIVGKIVQELSNTKPVTFIKIDIDKCKDSNLVSEVKTIPYFLFNKKGDNVNSYSGAGEAELNRYVNKNVNVKNLNTR